MPYGPVYEPQSIISCLQAWGKGGGMQSATLEARSGARGAVARQWRGAGAAFLWECLATESIVARRPPRRCGSRVVGHPEEVREPEEAREPCESVPRRAGV